MSDFHWEAQGGVGAVEAAAIAAVVQHVLEQEEAQRAHPAHRPELSTWTVVGRSVVPHLPRDGVQGKALSGYLRAARE